MRVVRELYGLFSRPLSLVAEVLIISTTQHKEAAFPVRLLYYISFS
jgi:hypothetical protein